ncbi:uncharacterized protein K452DRAFT_3984 [Aplosporella prunicola CBS 121167]|uniref:Uncharacterized protein n=1 Tax=Aplosporella prunicola CBS 121167 TaxID=1176127 RepID=A0A6A6BTV7_9PEZI|nr:uncharacterized protein K452DRAFT_3984 [Aplosporella prunicola CBS 121167]KAF2147248.1 hypothetical protein K452DRAFT_3984 [Aplosporella prunicola CBS 121167]
MNKYTNKQTNKQIFNGKDWIGKQTQINKQSNHSNNNKRTYAYIYTCISIYTSISKFKPTRQTRNTSLFLQRSQLGTSTAPQGQETSNKQARALPRNRSKPKPKLPTHPSHPLSLPLLSLSFPPPGADPSQPSPAQPGLVQARLDPWFLTITRSLPTPLSAPRRA